MVAYTKEEIVVSGNRCPQGISYATKEITNPCRMLTTTVKTAFADFPRLPVRSALEIPLKTILPAMQALQTITVEKRLQPGDVVLTCIPGTDVPLVATAGMTE
jgi:CxxC motif-containing protein